MKHLIAALLLVACAGSGAHTVATASSNNGQTLALHDTPGACQGGRHEAFLYDARKKTTLRGCWAPDGDDTDVQWDNGRRTTFPSSVILWVKA